MTLLAKRMDRPDRLRDALRRITVNECVRDHDLATLRCCPHGIAVDGDLASASLDTEDLASGAEEGSPTLLCGIGPCQSMLVGSRPISNS